MPDLNAGSAELDRWGFWRFIYLLVVSKAGRPRLYRVHVRIRDADAGALIQSGIKSLSVRLALRDDLLRATIDPTAALVPANIDTALARGNTCAAAFDGERLVSYVWRCSSTARLFDDVWLQLQKPCRYDYKAYTHPPYTAHDSTHAAARTDVVGVAGWLPLRSQRPGEGRWTLLRRGR